MIIPDPLLTGTSTLQVTPSFPRRDNDAFVDVTDTFCQEMEKADGAADIANGLMSGFKGKE